MLRPGNVSNLIFFSERVFRCNLTFFSELCFDTEAKSNKYETKQSLKKEKKKKRREEKAEVGVLLLRCVQTLHVLQVLTCSTCVYTQLREKTVKAMKKKKAAVIKKK